MRGLSALLRESAQQFPERIAIEEPGGRSTRYAQLDLSATELVFNFFSDSLGYDPVSGWTANSTDGCIAANRFMCGAGTVAAVNEPSS